MGLSFGQHVALICSIQKRKKIGLYSSIATTGLTAVSYLIRGMIYNKYINATNLDENYIINLKINLKDVYLNICKEIIILGKQINHYLIVKKNLKLSRKIFLK